jgi:general secretion pathway protein B
MSFILDALRKSENARLRQEHPAMFDARPLATRRRFPAWFLALGLLLGLNLLALLYVLLRDERSAAAAAPDAMTSLTAEAVAATTPSSSSTGPVGTAAGNTAAAVPAAAPAPSVMPATDRAAAAAATTTPAAVTRSSAAPGALAGTPAVALAGTPARTRDDLLAAGDAVPETEVSLHVYDADPGKRFVFLNGQRLREGEVAANGLRVERIDADGVVLDHRGSDFKVPLEP